MELSDAVHFLDSFSRNRTNQTMETELVSHSRAGLRKLRKYYLVTACAVLMLSEDFSLQDEHSASYS